MMPSALLRLAVAALALLAAAAAPAAAARTLAAAPKAYTAKTLAGAWSGTAKGPIPVPNTQFVCDSVNYAVTYTATTFSEKFECSIGALKVPLTNTGSFTVSGSSIKRSGCSNAQLCAGTLGIAKASATGLTLKSSVLGGKSLALKKAAAGRR